MAQDIGSTLPELPALNEKKLISHDSAEDIDQKAESLYEKASSIEGSYEGQKPGVKYVNGEPVITTGEDVSNFLFDVRDDGDPALTFRSLVLGTVFAGLGAALCQVGIPEI